MINRTANRIKLTIIFILFISPIIGAQLYFLYGDHSQLKTSNKGTLINPPYNLANPALKLDVSKIKVYSHKSNYNKNSLVDKFSSNKWHILSSQNNQNILYKLGQAQTALGKNSDRVQIAIIDKNYNNKILKNNHLYISDPHGNIILYYKLDDVQFDAKILKDLKKLLSISKIG